MKKVQAILAILLVVTFSILIMKNTLQGFWKSQTPTTQTSKNSSVTQRAEPTTNTKEDATNAPFDGQKSRVGFSAVLSTLCTDEPSQLENESWYQSFQKARGKYIASNAQGFQEVVELCWEERTGNVVFILENKRQQNPEVTAAQQIGYWKDGDMNVTMLSISQPEGSAATTSQYTLRGWINSESFILATSILQESNVSYEIVQSATGEKTLIQRCTLINNQEAC